MSIQARGPPRTERAGKCSPFHHQMWPEKLYQGARAPYSLAKQSAHLFPVPIFRTLSNMADKEGVVVGSHPAARFGTGDRGVLLIVSDQKSNDLKMYIIPNDHLH